MAEEYVGGSHGAVAPDGTSVWGALGEVFRVHLQNWMVQELGVGVGVVGWASGSRL